MPPCLHPVADLKITLQPLIAADVPVYNAFNIFTSMGDCKHISRILKSKFGLIQSYAAFKSMKHKNKGLDVMCIEFCNTKIASVVDRLARKPN